MRLRWRCTDERSEQLAQRRETPPYRSNVRLRIPRLERLLQWRQQRMVAHDGLQPF